jgi:hypothetical protein
MILALLDIVVPVYGIVLVGFLYAMARSRRWSRPSSSGAISRAWS